jgi:WD40 repeat protein
MKVLLQWCLALLCLFGMSDVKSQDLKFNQAAVAKPEIVLPIGHLGYMENAVFSPDGKFIVTSNDDGTAKVYDVSTGKELRTLKGHRDGLTGALYSPDGKLILTISDDSTAILYDAFTGAIIRRFENNNNDIDDAKFIMGGKYLVITTEDYSKVYETSTGDEKSKTKPAIFSEEGNYIEIKDSKKKFTVYNLFSKRKKYTLPNCFNLEMYSTFSKDGSLFFANVSDSFFVVYDIVNERKLYTFSTNRNRISFATFSPTNKYLVVGTRDSVISFYNHKGILELKSKCKSVLETAFFIPDEKSIVLFYENYGSFRDNNPIPPIQLFDIQQRKVVTEIPHEDYLVSIDINASGTKLITTSFEENTIWDLASGKKLTALTPNSLYLNTINFSPDNNNLVIACPYAKIWEIRKGKPVAELKDGKSRIFKAVYNKKGDKIFSYCSDSATRIWNAADGKLIKKINTIDRNSYFSESNNTLINYDLFPEKFHAYDLENGAYLKELNSSECTTVNDFGFVSICGTTKDGSRFIIANGRKINIWDVNLGMLIYNLSGHKATILSAKLSDDDTKLVTACADNTAKVWNMNNGNLLYTIYGHKDEVHDAVFSHDLKTIATASEDGTVKLWDAKTGKLINTLSGHQNGVRKVVFNSDDSRLLAAQYGNAVLWDLKTFTQIANLTGHYETTECAFSSDNKFIMSYGRFDHVIHIWDNMGKKLYSMLFIGENDYLVFDENNHYDGTKGAMEQLFYTSGNNIVSPAELSNKDYVPGLVEKIMSNY